VSVPLWVGELAEAFWDAAGRPGPFPRALRAACERGFPLTVEVRPGLSLGAVRDWLCRRGGRWAWASLAGAAGRALRACLAAWRGGGVIFLEAGDDTAEQRFSLAHEVAHFLRDYLWPRREAERALGPGVLEVLDGRPPRREERLGAVLRNVPLGFHAHLLARDPGGPEAEAERGADRLAYELLAPAEAVLGEASAGLEGRLRERYGLPAAQAARYARLLRPPPPPRDPLLARLWAARKNAG
jgi:hypothetical protein